MSAAASGWIGLQRAKPGLPMARAAWQNARWLDGTGKASDILAKQLLEAGREMPAQDHGRILITGSIAGFMPGTNQALYNGRTPR